MRHRKEGGEAGDLTANTLDTANKGVCTGGEDKTFGSALLCGGSSLSHADARAVRTTGCCSFARAAAPPGL